MSQSVDLTRLRDVYIAEFFEALDCPRALACYLLYTYGEHKQLAELTFEPLFYNDLNTARDSLAATKFLSKADFLKTGNDLKSIAMESFFAAEASCATTNQRIRGSRFKNPRTSDVLLGMSYKISNMLGSIGPEELIDSCNWGPGATTLLRRSQATHPNKFSVERKITAEAYDFVKPWFHLAYPLWDLTFEIDGFAKVVTVPKNAKTDRTIAIEPGLNLWFQKGIAKLLRRALKHNGIDLSDQTINQERARIGSKFNKLATVDFSMASDTVSIEIVREVLPSNWFTLLSVFRSKSATVDGKELVLHKFSSMGNGFTFELESLIFYAMAVATCDCLGVETKGISVFGDDVVLPSSAFDLFVSVSEDLGFKVNVQKSYSSGPYRESCGSHFWNGVDIKPIFLKGTFDGLQAVIKAANSIRLLAHRRNSYGCDARLRTAWRILTGFLGQKCPRIPMGYGDLGIIENFDDPAVNAKPAKHGYEGYFVPVYAVQAENLTVFGKGLLLYKLKSMGKGPRDLFDLDDPSDGGNHIPLPGRIHYVRKRILVPQWEDVGPWV